MQKNLFVESDDMKGIKVEWTEDQDKIILDNYSTKGTKVIGKILGLAETTIYNRAMVLGITEARTSIYCNRQDQDALIHKKRIEKAKQIAATGKVGLWKVHKTYKDKVVLIIRTRSGQSFLECFTYDDIARRMWGDKDGR